MLIPDVNVLVYAHRDDVPDSVGFGDWLRAARTGSEALGLCTAVTTGFIRVVTNPRIFPVDPTPLDVAVRFVSALRASSATLSIEPGENHWEIFSRLVDATTLSSNDVPDAALAALAIERDATLMSADRGFARFPGLGWRARP